jgi:hypothetical protein
MYSVREIAMIRHSKAKALYEGILIIINSRHRNVNIMMFGETTLALLVGNKPEE